ncbi:gamma-carboxylase [Bacillus toyonensis]|uniref:HTTM domain-containing protein n=1 Tax=Bacillus toyonensis TaxID=155322 RepID=UPI000BEE7938|nr:HTTM domain-containing protein [Bacillus toyonensis]PEB23382.1 gamma-carboxylase [Bacillus toyonensis]PFY79502.1 gamma-carboxylase [Bacillus toyonensis]PHG55149.1 gamma-carboxylase [Bacillus toyonensis]
MNQSISTRILNCFLQEKYYKGASLLRISFGILTLYFYLIQYSQRHFLYSEVGYNANYFGVAPSLYSLNSSLLYFDVIYLLGILFTFIYTIGYKGRFISILNFIFYYSLYVRMGSISDGGDNLMCISLFFLLFADCTRYFSIDAIKGKKITNRNNTLVNNISTILHNFSILFCITQVCVVYATSGIYQVMGNLWNNGTALYYVSQVNTVSTPFLKEWVNNYVYLAVIFTYLSIFVKLAFPLLIINKRTKLFGVIAICFFHAGIGIGMGLYSFSIVMISMELLIFTDGEYQKYTKKLKDWYKQISILWKSKISRVENKELYKSK